jgi:hypothetical protein
MMIDDTSDMVTMTRAEQAALVDRAEWAERQLAELKTCIARMADPATARQSSAIAAAVRASNSEPANATKH